MPEIIEVSTVERHLFPSDVIPWAELQLESNLVEFKKRYRFSHIRQGLNPDGKVVRLIAEDGEFVCGDTTCVVDHLLFEANAIELEISVDSERSGMFFKDLALFLTQIDPKRAFSGSRECARTYQTLAITKLAISSDAFLSAALQTFIAERVPPKLRPPDAEVEIKLDRLVWRVNYATRRTDFIYLPRELIIEARAGSDPSETIYYTKSPTDFHTHKGLLEDIEASLAYAPK